MNQTRVRAPLRADRRRGAMNRVDTRVVTERKEDRADRSKQRDEMTPREIRPPNRSGKQRVAHEQLTLGLAGATDGETDSARAVAGRVQNVGDVRAECERGALVEPIDRRRALDFQTEQRALLHRLIVEKQVVAVQPHGYRERGFRARDSGHVVHMGMRQQHGFDGQRFDANRLDQLIDRLVLLGEPSDVLEKLSSFVATAPDQEVSRIRPIALARRYGLDARKFVATCIRAAREGLLVLMWDILCPLCRIPSEVVRSLAELSDHGHCEACDINFELDFANFEASLLNH